MSQPTEIKITLSPADIDDIFTLVSVHLSGPYAAPIRQWALAQHGSADYIPTEFVEVIQTAIGEAERSGTDRNLIRRASILSGRFSSAVRHDTDRS